MTLEEFRALLDRHGGDADRWPDTDRNEAAALLASDQAARDALADALALDRDLAAAPKAPPGLKDRILDAALKGKG